MLLALLRPYITQTVGKTALVVGLVAILLYCTWVPKGLIDVATYNVHSRTTTISPKCTHTHLEKLVIAFLNAANVLLVLDLQLVKVDVMESIAHIILLSELTLHLVISPVGTSR